LLAHVIMGRVLLLRPKTGEAIASVFFSFIATGLIVLVYNLDPFRNWTLLVGFWASSEAVILHLFQNQRKNEKKFRSIRYPFRTLREAGFSGNT
jgi:Kef-type K+ transport system membrane component KefB